METGIQNIPARAGMTMFAGFEANTEAGKPATRVIPVKTGIQDIPARAGMMMFVGVMANTEAGKPSTRVIPEKTGIQVIPSRAGMMYKRRLCFASPSRHLGGRDASCHNRYLGLP